MNRPTPFRMAPVLVQNLISRLLFPRSFPVVVLALALTFLAVPQGALAVDPPPDGGYANANTAEGDGALFSLTTGHGNTAVGSTALYFNTAGSENTATGYAALAYNSGSFNTANGSLALYSGGGQYNTATGASALQGGAGNNNTANGAYALYLNSADNNTATGANALRNNNGGQANTANGVNALSSNRADNNTATGANALAGNTTGFENTANGASALIHNTKGYRNTAYGLSALANSATGSNNIAIGYQAGMNLTLGNSNNIDIGNPGLAGGEASKIRIGQQGTQKATFIAGVYGSVFADGVQVVASPQGRLGTVTSSARFKEGIKPMDKTSEAILSLQPVTFRYKQELDPEGIPQFGLVAEQVEKVNPDLVARDTEGKAYTVRYDAVNAMLLNEFLKEHRKVEEQQAKAVEQQSTIDELKTTVAQQQKEISDQHVAASQQQKQIEALTAIVRNVSERVELSAPASQITANDR